MSKEITLKVKTHLFMPRLLRRYCLIPRANEIYHFHFYHFSFAFPKYQYSCNWPLQQALHIFRCSPFQSTQENALGSNRSHWLGLIYSFDLVSRHVSDIRPTDILRCYSIICSLRGKRKRDFIQVSIMKKDDRSGRLSINCSASLIFHSAEQYTPQRCVFRCATHV